MLRDEITIRQLLLEYSSGKISVDYVENEYTVACNNSDWDENSSYLPKYDSYMYAEDGEFDDEIAYFSSVDHVYYEAEYYKRITEVLGTIDKGIEPITEALTTFASAIGNIFTCTGASHIGNAPAKCSVIIPINLSKEPKIAL